MSQRIFDESRSIIYIPQITMIVCFHQEIPQGKLPENTTTTISLKKYMKSTKNTQFMQRKIKIKAHNKRPIKSNIYL